MKNLDPKFCLVPFTNFSISPRGIIRTCCNHYDMTMHTWENVKDLGNISWPTDRLVNMQKKMLEPDIEKNSPECKLCWQQENMGVPSYRTSYNEYWFNKLGMDKVYERIDNPRLNTLDVQFGHLCNNSCVMCNTSLSSHLFNTKNKLYKNTTDPEQKEFYKQDIDYITDHTDWTVNEYSYNKVLETCEIVDSVKISGGEPLFNPKFSHFLEHLLTKKIPLKRIHLTTNGTIYKDEIIEQLNKINEVIHLKLSVEATGRQEEFIRWPTVWQEKEQNIRKFIKNTRQDCSVFEISTCVQSLTLLTIFKVEKFVENLKAEFPDKRINFNKQPVGKGDISSSVHSDNEYLLYCKNFATLDVEKYINSALDFKDKKTRAQVLYYLDLAKIQGVNFAELFPIYWRYHKKYVE